MKNDKFSFLLAALLIYIVALPVAYDLELISLRLSRMLAISTLLAVGIWSLRGAGRMYYAGMIVVIAGIVMSLLSGALQNDRLDVAAELCLFVFLVLAIVNDLRQVAVGNDISLNRIIGAICVYLMLGVLWAVAYSVLEYAQPGSFAGLAEPASPVWNPDWVYYSFVTITTLGYGDILPLTQTARALAFSEAIAGQFYIAVLVAGLVSAYISAQGNNANQDGSSD